MEAASDILAGHKCRLLMNEENESSKQMLPCQYHEGYTKLRSPNVFSPLQVTQRKPSSSFFSSQIEDIIAPAKCESAFPLQTKGVRRIFGQIQSSILANVEILFIYVAWALQERVSSKAVHFWRIRHGCIISFGDQHSPVGGRTLSTNMKIAFSALNLILLRMTYTNCPTVKSAGTRYLQQFCQL